MNIYSLAKIANVSPSTVSKVINGKDGVGTETRNKILKLIEDEGFKPKISSNSASNIAVIIKRTEVCIFDSEFAAKLLNGISDYCFENKYNILLLSLTQIPRNKKEFNVYCHTQRILGCIFINLSVDDYFIEEISGIVPSVTINAKFSGDNLYSIMSDDLDGFYQATNYLYKMGHRKIAVAAMNLKFQSHRDKLAGYKKAMADLNLGVDDDYIINADGIDKSGLEMAFDHLRNMDKMPTAIMFLNDQEAQRGSEWLNQMNLSIPDDISIVGYDDYLFSSFMNPPLTTVKQVLYEKGIMAVKLMGLNQNEIQHYKGKTDFLFKTDLIIRRSVKKID